ncbi:thiamine-phosphate pyrophosphorylase [Phlyctochytrium arcticum]|nr:thiamine-phosphate pyrophosphorylase [Phlyctochytrium arcticum]KAI9098058.1 thiamine-phosphate pyrophosphorylase [Phlyctochytrium arcticum]
MTKDAGKNKTIDLSLYLVTDSGLLPEGRDLVDTVAEAIAGGVTLVQLREKKLGTRSFLALAQRLLKVCRAAGVPLLINDRIDIALAVDADGVHIGQDDMPLATARKLLGQDKIIGITVETAEQAKTAIANGADYLGSAAIFPTGTKQHPAGFKPLGVDGVRSLMESVQEHNLPMCTIGGIGFSNVEEILEGAVVRGGPGGRVYSLQGVAVVSAIIANDNPRAEAAALAAKIAAVKQRNVSTH